MKLKYHCIEQILLGKIFSFLPLSVFPTSWKCENTSVSYGLIYNSWCQLSKGRNENQALKEAVQHLTNENKLLESKIKESFLPLIFNGITIKLLINLNLILSVFLFWFKKRKPSCELVMFGITSNSRSIKILILIKKVIYNDEKQFTN